MAMAAGQGVECGQLIPLGTPNPVPFKSLPHPKKAGAGAKNIPQKGHRPKRQAQPPPPLRTAPIPPSTRRKNPGASPLQLQRV